MSYQATLYADLRSDVGMLATAMCLDGTEVGGVFVAIHDDVGELEMMRLDGTEVRIHFDDLAFIEFPLLRCQLEGESN